MSRALAVLSAEGLVVTEPGRGTFVATHAAESVQGPIDVGWQTVALQNRTVDTEDLMRQVALPDSGAIVLSTGYLDTGLQPTRAMAAALARAARRPGVWNRAPLAGIPELRATLATAIGVARADVLIVPGGQAGLSTALRALTPLGGSVLVESPTYFGLLALARSAGLRPVPVATDADGIRPDLLAETLAITGARVVCCQPMFANPTGSVLSAGRRRELLDVVHDAGAFLLEDDWARHLSYRSDPPAPLIRDDRHGNVVHLMSLTKPAAPGLRIGALAARGPAALRMRALRVVDDFFVPHPLQETALDLLTSTAWPRHLARLRRALTSRRDAMIAAVHRDLPGAQLTAVPDGGLSLWVRLPDGVSDLEVAQRCAVRGVLVSAGTPYYAGEPPAPHLRLTYCAEDEATIRRGIRLVGEVLGDALAG